MMSNKINPAGHCSAGINRGQKMGKFLEAQPVAAVDNYVVDFNECPLIHPPISRSRVNINSIEAMTKETDKMVSGTFMNVECPGQPATISCRYYKGQPFFSKTMEDGEMYEIPLSVARHINERIYHEPHSYIQDERGKYIKSPKKIFRHKFIVAA